MRARFHLLLCFSLIFNAIVAPWAMAMPSNADAAQHPAAHSAASSELTNDVDHSMHGAHQHQQANDAVSDALVAAGVEQAQGNAPAHSDCESSSSCCGGPLCLCGCMLPPVVAAAASIPSANTRPVAVSQGITPLALLTRSHPPFRPPAV